jgi:hypothetical protein
MSSNQCACAYQCASIDINISFEPAITVQLYQDLQPVQCVPPEVNLNLKRQQLPSSSSSPAQSFKPWSPSPTRKSTVSRVTNTCHAAIRRHSVRETTANTCHLATDTRMNRQHAHMPARRAAGRHTTSYPVSMNLPVPQQCQ